MARLIILTTPIRAHITSARAGAALVMREPLECPINAEEWQVTLNKKRLGPLFT